MPEPDWLPVAEMERIAPGMLLAAVLTGLALTGA